METLALVVLVIFSLVGFAAVFFTTFGTLIIMIGALLYALMTEFAVINFKTLVILFALYLFGEIIEYIAIVLGVKKLGASNAAIAGAIIGGILGAAIGAAFFGVGLILGAFLGIFLGAFLVELALKKDVMGSLKAGAGGVLGRLGSVIVKVIIAIAMFIILATNIADADEALKDGTYTGKSSMMDVEIEIDDGVIEDIDILEHRGGTDEHLEMISSLSDEIILKQTTEVDTITGATLSSTALKEAVSNALAKAER
jgi:uncharacterized protein with FMN-binding domain